MLTHFDLSTYIYANLLNSKNVPWQFATAISNCCGKILLRLLRPNFEGCITKEKNTKIFCKSCDLKTSSRAFCVCKELGTTSMDNEIFEASSLYWRCNSKTIKICPNQYADLSRFLFTEDSLKAKKSLELVSRPHFS